MEFVDLNLQNMIPFGAMGILTLLIFLISRKQDKAPDPAPAIATRSVSQTAPRTESEEVVMRRITMALRQGKRPTVVIAKHRRPGAAPTTRATQVVGVNGDQVVCTTNGLARFSRPLGHVRRVA